MMRVARVSTLLAAAMAVSLQAGQLRQPPAFRAGTDLVSVNVSVRAGNQPVAGLTSADFTLLDNGVPQRVQQVEMAAVPVDFTLVIAVHNSMAGNVQQFRSETVAIAKLLRPADRLRVLELGTDVVEVFPLQRVDAGSAQEQLKGSFKTGSTDAGGFGAVYDALVAALILPSVSDRRQLVIALMGGGDAISVLSRDRAVAVAARTEATLYIQLFSRAMPLAKGASATHLIYGSFPYLLAGEIDPLSAEEAMNEIAQATGGQAYTPGLLGRSAVDTFKRIFDEYRRSYLLQYELTGVSREGWHDIAVKVTRPGRFDIHARRGYFIDGVPR